MARQQWDGQGVGAFDDWVLQAIEMLDNLCDRMHGYDVLKTKDGKQTVRCLGSGGRLIRTTAQSYSCQPLVPAHSGLSVVAFRWASSRFGLCETEAPSARLGFH